MYRETFSFPEQKQMCFQEPDFQKTKISWPPMRMATPHDLDQRATLNLQAMKWLGPKKSDARKTMACWATVESQKTLFTVSEGHLNFTTKCFDQTTCQKTGSHGLNSIIETAFFVGQQGQSSKFGPSTVFWTGLFIIRILNDTWITQNGYTWNMWRDRKVGQRSEDHLATIIAENGLEGQQSNGAVMDWLDIGGTKPLLPSNQLYPRQCVWLWA